MLGTERIVGGGSILPSNLFIDERFKEDLVISNVPAAYDALYQEIDRIYSVVLGLVSIKSIDDLGVIGNNGVVYVGDEWSMQIKVNKGIGFSYIDYMSVHLTDEWDRNGIDFSVQSGNPSKLSLYGNSILSAPKEMKYSLTGTSRVCRFSNYGITVSQQRITAGLLLIGGIPFKTEVENISKALGLFTTTRLNGLSKINLM